MEQREKLEQMRHHLSGMGLPRNAWHLPYDDCSGVLASKRRPPLFWSFGALALLFGGFFGMFWGALMWWFVWSDQDMSLVAAVIGATVAGVLFGLCMATYFRYFARKYNLPLWAAYMPPPRPHV